MAHSFRFRIVDFRPAPEGWRTVWLTADGTKLLPLPGWLVREEFEFDSPDSDNGRSTGTRDVVAGRLEDYAVEPIDFNDDAFWFVLGPGETEPDDTEVAAEIRKRQARKTP